MTRHGHRTREHPRRTPSGFRRSLHFHRTNGCAYFSATTFFFSSSLSSSSSSTSSSSLSSSRPLFHSIPLGRYSRSGRHTRARAPSTSLFTPRARTQHSVRRDDPLRYAHLDKSSALTKRTQLDCDRLVKGAPIRRQFDRVRSRNRQLARDRELARPPSMLKCAINKQCNSHGGKK